MPGSWGVLPPQSAISETMHLTLCVAELSSSLHTLHMYSIFLLACYMLYKFWFLLNSSTGAFAFFFVCNHCLMLSWLNNVFNTERSEFCYYCFYFFIIFNFKCLTWILPYLLWVKSFVPCLFGFWHCMTLYILNMDKSTLQS